MTLELDISDDFKAVVDWLKPVTVDGQPVSEVLRRAISTREAIASGGKYQSSDVAFHVDTADFADQPNLGSSIVDDDGTWTVIQVRKETLANRWRCVSRQLKLSSPVTVTIETATFAKGDSGAQEPVWASSTTASAEIHIDHERNLIQNDTRVGVQKAKVYFAEVQTLTTQNRIVGPDSTVYTVIKWMGLDDIKNLFYAECEVSKWPRN